MIKQGDVVRCNSHVMPMTVSDMGNGLTIECTWFDENGQLNKRWFSITDVIRCSQVEPFNPMTIPPDSEELYEGVFVKTDEHSIFLHVNNCSIGVLKRDMAKYCGEEVPASTTQVEEFNKQMAELEESVSNKNALIEKVKEQLEVALAEHAKESKETLRALLDALNES